MDKFGRNYALYIQEKGTSVALRNNAIGSQPITVNAEGFILIQPPFTLEVDINKNILSSANMSTFRIYNLSEKNRNNIFKSQIDTAQFKQIQLQAGYGDNLSVIFNGNMTEGFSVREGSNFITNCDSQDAGFAFANGPLNANFPPGTPQGDIIKGILQTVPDLQIGKIGNYNYISKRGTSYSGDALDIVRTISGGGMFVDNGKIHVLLDNEALQGPFDLIDSDTGLLGTPLLEAGVFVVINILFEPRLLIGQKIILLSSTSNNYNGVYKVVGIDHKVTFSSAISGPATTTVKLLGKSNGLTVVQ